MKALLLPYLDTAGLDLLATPEVELEAVFRQQDRKLDLSLATEEATTTFLDLDISPPPHLQQLRLDTTVPALIESNILRNDKTRVPAAATCDPPLCLDVCLVTSEHVYTLDKLYHPYSPADCWTLVSADCAETPGGTDLQ